MKNILLITLIALALSGCVGISTSSIPDETNILVITKSSDEFKFIYKGYHPISKMAKQQIIPIKQNWTLSSVVQETLESPNTQSRFNFVFDDNINIRNRASDNQSIYQLAKKMNANYVLTVETNHVWDKHGDTTYDAEYGYFHEIFLSMVKLKPVGLVYANLQFYLTETNALMDANPTQGDCGVNAPGHLKSELAKDIDLPLKIKDGDIRDYLTAEKLETISLLTKEYIARRITKNLSFCDLVEN